nr:hypothetical protein OG999_08565 [Streptomyces sp. NBC_00886]
MGAAGGGGFDHTFIAYAIIVAGVAAVGALLLPTGRPDPSQGPDMAH